MQKIFIIHGDYSATPQDKGAYHLVNEFMGQNGFVVSVHPQSVDSGNGTEIRGRWLVVADNGVKEGVNL